MPSLKQRTVKQSVQCTGIGLHSGRPVTMRITPSGVGQGIVFVRLDDGGRRVRARVENVTRTRFATTLAENGTRVATTEHLLSALSALEIDNAVIELDGAEVPILDGSAAPFLYMLHEAGITELRAPRPVLVLRQPLWIADEVSTIRVSPAPVLSVQYHIEFPHPIVGAQRYRSIITRRSYVEEIATARTFCFLRDVEALRRQGLALGGSLDNAVVVGDDGILNDSLRFTDEFVRHKVLDLLGDLALLGCALRAHVEAHRAGHRLHTRLVQEILARPETWTIEHGGESFDELLPVQPQPAAAGITAAV